MASHYVRRGRGGLAILEASDFVDLSRGGMGASSGDPGRGIPPYPRNLPGIPASGAGRLNLPCKKPPGDSKRPYVRRAARFEFGQRPVGRRARKFLAYPIISRR